MRVLPSAEAVIAEVRESFPLHPIPHNVGISAHTPEVNGFFNGRTWDRVTIDTLLQESEMGADHALFWMNDEGFRYYVPAYILMTFSERAKAEIWMLEPFLWVLSAYATYRASVPPQLDPEKVARFDGFSAAQKRAIANYLVYQAYVPEDEIPTTILPDLAQKALTSYWQPYADG